MGGTDVSASRASSEAVPQATAAATYFIFGNDANVSAATDQSLTATPTATAVAATGGSASAAHTGPGQAMLSPSQFSEPIGNSGVSLETVVIIAVASVAVAVLARRFF
jgi:hypothetical protein